MLGADMTTQKSYAAARDMALSALAGHAEAPRLVKTPWAALVWLWMATQAGQHRDPPTNPMQSHVMIPSGPTPWEGEIKDAWSYKPARKF